METTKNFPKVNIEVVHLQILNMTTGKKIKNIGPPAEVLHPTPNMNERKNDIDTEKKTEERSTVVDNKKNYTGANNC